MSMPSETQPVSLMALAASRKDELQRIADAGLMGQGKVFLLSLEPIKVEVGKRWPLRSEVVWDAVEKALAKAMPPPDVFVRLNDTSVLVAVASADSYEGQVRCVNVLRSLLTFFLGRSVDADVSLSRISGIEGDSLSAQPVDLNAPSTALRDTPGVSAKSSRRGPEDWTPPLTDRRTRGLITLTYYGEVPFEIDVRPVWRLDRETVSSYAIRLRLPSGLEQLSDVDHEKLSHLTLGHVLPILEDYRREGGVFALIVPLSFSALSARRPRLALLERCAGVKDLMRRAVIVEISNLDPGVPLGLIRETVSMIRPFVRVVTATVNTPAEVTSLYREAAFHGVSVDWPTGRNAALETVLKAARRRTPNVIVHDVPAEIEGDTLRSYQASHATWMPKAEK